MIDHTGIGVADMGVSARFYDAALAPLGLKRVDEMEEDGVLVGVAYGVDHPEFWLDKFHPPGVRQHTAFRAKDQAAVRSFHAAGAAAGGRDNGPPGLRSGGYPPGYYAAFLCDPDGNNIEAVHRG